MERSADRMVGKASWDSGSVPREASEKIARVIFWCCVMPRTARASLGGVCTHVMNRGNGRGEVFHKEADYERFLEMVAEAGDRVAMRVLGWCLMPNHFHLVVWPLEDGDLGRWMQWLMTSHVRRYHRHYHSSGHVWQGRYKAFAIQEDGHYLTVLRYVERNALRAGLVERAEDWRWSSVCGWARGQQDWLLSEGPVARPREWVRLVNAEQRSEEAERIRTCMQRQRPLGGPIWTKRMAKVLGLECSIRPLGRPRKPEKK